MKNAAEPFREHIPIEMLWQIRAKVIFFSDEQSAHFLGCDQCIIAYAICRMSQTIEEAQQRLKDHLAVD